MNTHKSKGSSKIFFLPIILTGLFIFLYPADIGEAYRYTFIACAVSVVAVFFMLADYIVKYGFDIFEPIYFITAIYGMMYFVTPIYDILIGEYRWFGYDLFPHGVKATLVALVGYFAFYIFYRYRFVFNKAPIVKTVDKKQDEQSTNTPVIQDNSKIIFVILIIYVVSFVANAFYLISYYGVSLTYILTLGLWGDAGREATSASIGFISMLSYCLPTATLLYWEYGNSKALKVILFVPMLMMQIAQGFRFLIVQIAVTFLAYWFIKNRKRPKISQILIVLVAVMVPVILMTMFRDDMRTGNGMAFNTINAESLQDGFEAAVWENFRIYKNFYGMVDAIPSRQGFVFGRQMIIGTIVMVIPRIIWPGKISSYGGPGLADLIGNNFEGTGQAYSNIGEYYYALGVLGVVICMAVYGWWARRTKTKYMSNPDNGLGVIVFSSLLGANIQLLIRGYFPSNFWYLVFLLIPVWIVKLIRKETTD